MANDNTLYIFLSSSRSPPCNRRVTAAELPFLNFSKKNEKNEKNEKKMKKKKSLDFRCQIRFSLEALYSGGGK